jgi:hypothetical protein
MGKHNHDGGLLPVHSMQQQSQQQKLAFIGLLSLLLTVNLYYFVKTHTKIELLTATAGAPGRGAAAELGSASDGVEVS